MNLTFKIDEIYNKHNRCASVYGLWYQSIVRYSSILTVDDFHFWWFQYDLGLMNRLTNHAKSVNFRLGHKFYRYIGEVLTTYGDIFCSLGLMRYAIKDTIPVDFGNIELKSTVVQFLHLPKVA